MKATFTLLTILVCTTISMAQVQSGLVAQYSFNKGNANDDIGQNNGLAQSVTATADRFGNSGYAYSFDESSIIIKHDKQLDLGISDFSVSLWFKTKNIDANNVFINKGEGTTIRPRFFIRTLAGGTFQWRIGDGNEHVTESWDAAKYFDDEWHHLTFIRNGHIVWVYIDGEKVKTTENMDLPFLDIDGPRPFILGAQDSVLSEATPMGSFLTGGLDDIRIYNRPLSEQEVDSLFNEENPVMVGVANGDQPVLSVYPNPVSDCFVIKNAETIEALSLIDLAGNEIRSFNPSLINYSISDLPKGAYLLRVVTNNGSTVSRLVKH